MNRFLEQLISIPLWLPFGIGTIVSHGMTRYNRLVKYLKRATYDELEVKMLQTDWVYQKHWPNSLFTNDDSAYFHAGIIRLGDVGYIMTPYGYLRANMLQRKIKRTLPGYIASKKPYLKTK